MLSNSFSRVLLAIGIFTLVLYSCKTLSPVHKAGVRLSVLPAEQFDSATYILYVPYKNGLEEQMKQPVASLETDLFLEKPESSLGNHIAEVLKWQIVRSSGASPDFCFYNFGGIRSHSLARGVLRVEDAYKLLPFDNVPVTLTVSGNTVYKIFETMSTGGGWPIVDASYRIQANKPASILIQGQPLDTNRTYTIGTIDFLAQGGDNMDYLKKYPINTTGVLMRDALLNYWQLQQQQGALISGAKKGYVVKDE